MPETFQDIRHLREEWEATLPAEAYRQRLAEKIDELAVGAPGRAELLECLSSDLDETDPERSLSLARAAEADGGPTTIDARVAVVRALYRLGRDDEAGDLARQLLRSSSREDVTVGLHTALGEVLEMVPLPREAQRAYTVGLKGVDPEIDDDDDLTMDDVLCLTGRYRVRRALGAGRDGYDRFFEQVSPSVADALVGPHPNGR